MGKMFDENTLRPEYITYIWWFTIWRWSPSYVTEECLQLLLEDPRLSAFAFSAPPHPEPLLKLYMSTPCGALWALSLSNTGQLWLTLKTQLSVNAHVWKPTMLRSHTYWKMVVILIRNSPFYMWSWNRAGPCGTPAHKRLSVSLVFLLAGNSHVRMWELDYKESWVPKTWCFWTVVLEKALKGPLDSKKIQPVHPKGNRSWILIRRTDAEASWSSNTLATWCKELTPWKRPWCYGRLKAGGEGDDRGWDGWMTSPSQWTWVWVNSGNWWWTGRPSMLQSMWSQRVEHDRETKLRFHSASMAFPEFQRARYKWLLIREGRGRWDRGGEAKNKKQ